MKKQVGIWIDGKEAIIINLGDEANNTLKIESDLENRIYHDKEGDKGSFMGSRHIDNETKFNERRENEMNHFLKEVMAAISDADEVFVFGPAETKLKLKHEMESNKAMQKKVTCFEAAERMTANQIVAKVKEHYAA
jgi:hypothetical protein